MLKKFRELNLEENQIALLYLGQEGFLIKTKNKYILIDGYLSDYVDQNCCSQEVKWVRNYPSPISGEELSFVDYVFCTHGHADHADPDTLSAINRVNTKAMYIVPNPIVPMICSFGISEKNIIPAKADMEITLGEICVMPIPAAHEQLNQDENGDYCELGYKIEMGGTTLFHSGDCCVYDGLEERLCGVDIAMLPINGRDYYRLSNNIVGNMDSKEAVILSQRIHAKLLIPMHFDLYEINSVNPAHFVDCLQRINPKQGFHIFAVGETYIF